MQAAWAVLFALPMLVAAQNPRPGPTLLASRGAAYREYQRIASPFFPWPPTEGGA